MISLTRRCNLLRPISRLFNWPGPQTEVAVTDQMAECPRAFDGVSPIERCMQCDRLVSLQVDADGAGTVICRAGQ